MQQLAEFKLSQEFYEVSTFRGLRADDWFICTMWYKILVSDWLFTIVRPCTTVMNLMNRQMEASPGVSDDNSTAVT